MIYDPPLDGIKRVSLGKYGLCSRCKHLKVQITRLHDECVICMANNDNRGTLRPSRYDPVVICSDFYHKNQPDLWEMERMATIIDVNVRKPAGFELSSTDEIREVTVKKPKCED